MPPFTSPRLNKICPNPNIDVCVDFLQLSQGYTARHIDFELFCQEREMNPQMIDF